jgi:GNAT superfamily N-acetyltransferase
MSEIVVREARTSELPEAGDVVVRAYRALPGQPGPSFESYLEHVRDAAGRAGVCPVLVAVDGDDRLLGCVTYVPDRGNPFAEVQRGDEAGFRMLGVAPEAQGRGAGRALVEACIAHAREERRSGLAISTSPVMRTAHRLYERLGFRRAPDRDFEPVEGVHLWTYVLQL